MASFARRHCSALSLLSFLRMHKGARGIAGMISLTQVMHHQIAAPSRPQKKQVG
ncbi:hypothetical protein SCH4B_1935 [Ruegeria sp. TrichCH4B]|nr:hypothetical protein SCH4B_1935 [Ruegeria sp. TrichCH4B]